MILLLSLACAAPAPDCPSWFSDVDGDGFGAGDGVSSCDALPGRVEQDGDCDDRDSSVHPGALDPALDGLDQDCDGEDTCAAAIPVDSMAEVDCELGHFVVKDFSTSWPEGDCVCQVGGLSLDAEVAERLNGTLQVIDGELRLGSQLDPWTGQGLEGLRSLGSANLRLAGVASLPKLQQAEVLLISGELPSSFEAPTLTTVSDLSVAGSLESSFQGLQEIEEAWVELSPGYALNASSLTEVGERLTLASGAANLLQLRSVPELAVQGQSALYAPSLEQVERLELRNEPQLWLPSLKALYELIYTGSSEPPELILPHLEALTTLSVTQATLRLPRLETAEYLTLEFALLDLPVLKWVDLANLKEESALRAPLLAHAERFYANYMPEGGESVLDGLQSVGDLNLYRAELSLPALREAETLKVGSFSKASLPALSHVETLIVYSPVSLPALTSVKDQLVLEVEGNQLPQLRSVGKLYTRDCEAVSELQYLHLSVISSCQLDLRPLHDLPDPFRVGLDSGPFILPEPFPNAIQVRRSGGDEALDIEIEVLEKALSIRHSESIALRETTKIRHVQGQISATLYRATSLGGLAYVETIAKDLLYCMPEMPQSELDAWLSTVSVGGETINQCP